MNTTTKKKPQKTAQKKSQSEKEEIYYDPETGKRISKTGYFMRKIKAEGGGVRIIDMKAVLR